MSLHFRRHLLFGKQEPYFPVCSPRVSIFPSSYHFCWIRSKLELLCLLCLFVFLAINIRFYSVDSITEDIQTSGNLSVVTSTCKSPLGCLPLLPRTCTTCPGIQSPPGHEMLGHEMLGHEMGELPHRRVGTWASDSCFHGLSIHLIIACFSHLHFQRHLLPPVLATRDSVV